MDRYSREVSEATDRGEYLAKRSAPVLTGVAKRQRALGDAYQSRFAQANPGRFTPASRQELAGLSRAMQMADENRKFGHAINMEQVGNLYGDATARTLAMGINSKDMVNAGAYSPLAMDNRPAAAKAGGQASAAPATATPVAPPQVPPPATAPAKKKPSPVHRFIDEYGNVTFNDAGQGSLYEPPSYAPGLTSSE